MSRLARQWLERILTLPLATPVRIMNVCGGQERVVSHSGLRGLLPPTIELIPGPGCPVCVCPEQDIYHAIQLALHQPVTLLAFGDMLQVPVNTPKGMARTLEQVRSMGADVRPIAAPQQAVAMAKSQPERAFVFFAAGFETTMAPVAAMVAECMPDNLSLLISGRLTWPAVAMLLAQDHCHLDALIAPGHVAAIMGPEQWRFIAERHHLPVAVAGFTDETLLEAIYHCLAQHLEGRPQLQNCYPTVVRPGGNPTAQRILQQVFGVVDTQWRGIGTLPASGYALRENYSRHDARLLWPLADEERQRGGEMPQGCACAEVVLGRITPEKCPLYGKSCRPNHPIGPCMVSDEGACRIWWQG